MSSTTWTDSSGNFWLFGGYGIDGSGNSGISTTSGNSRWQLDLVSGGNTNLANQNGVYGTHGTPSASNVPGGRRSSWLGRFEWKSLAIRRRRPRFNRNAKRDPERSLGLQHCEQSMDLRSMGSTIGVANQTGTYELQPSIGPVNTTGAANTCGLTVGLTRARNSFALLCHGRSFSWFALGREWLDGQGRKFLTVWRMGIGFDRDQRQRSPQRYVGLHTKCHGWSAWYVGLVKGSNTGSQNGIYGPPCQPYHILFWTPGGRSGATHWVDGMGQFWMFGGEGYDSTSTTGTAT